MKKEKSPCERDLGTPLKQCPRRGAPWLIGDNQSQGKRKIVKARCKQWDCEYCAQINKSTHYNRIASGIDLLFREKYELQFVTITCHEKWRGHENSIRNWRRNKDKLMARYRRHTRKCGHGKTDYVYIPECHMDGSIHVHGAFIGDASTRWWKDNSRESGLGYMAESSQLTSALQAISYMLKYIQKEMGKKQPAIGFRRICYSQGFPPIPRLPSGYEWDILPSDETIETAIRFGLMRLGVSVEFAGDTFETVDDLYP